MEESLCKKKVKSMHCRGFPQRERVSIRFLRRIASQFLWKPTCRRTARTIFYKLFGFSICGATKTKPSVWTYLHGFSARIFCTDFLHGYLNTDFSHGFFARIFARNFLHGFVHGFLHRCFCAVALHEFLHGFCTDFLHGFLGVFQSTCCEAPKIHKENPLENSPWFGGLLGRGLGGRRVRWRLWST